MQFSWAVTRWNRRAVSSTNIPTPEDTETGAVPASAALPAGDHAQDDG